MCHAVKVLRHRKCRNPEGPNEIHPLLREIRDERASGKIYKRFEDDYYALDLLKILYDDTVENSIKVELLINLEEYGLLGITEDSIDQIVTSLLDIYHQCVDKGDNWPVVCQILTTCTSLIVQLEQQLSDLCKTVVKELVSIVTSRVNQPDSHRLRSCACQCLIHLEEFEPGLLVNHCDDFCQLARQERTEVFQDYALLAAKVLASTGSFSGEKSTGLLQQDVQKNVQKQISYEPQDVRQIVAYLVENLPVYTRSGTFRIVESLSSLVKCMPEVSPMIFKPPMLHQMSTMSCVIFHTVLYLQREFKGEILSQQEEVDLIQRLCYMTDHPSLNQLHRLLASQWAHMYQVQNGDEKVAIHDSIKQKHRLVFYPSVFDSIDGQLRKLYMTAVCGETTHDIAGVETSILLGSLGCLHKLVWHTGSSLAARCLFKALYFIYTYHNNRSFSKDIQRFVRGLISEFAHFIPHSIDFADSINSLGIDRQVYVDTLVLLHQQVVMATEEQICNSFQFYLEIMKKAGAHQEIDPKPTLKFLSYLAENADIIDDSSWKLGHGILDICKNMIMCHGTHICFLDEDVFKTPAEVKKRYATLSFIITAAFVLPALTLLGRAVHKINRNQIKAFSHHLAYITWILVACLLICIFIILNLFDSFINSDVQSKSGKTCYYIYVIYGTLETFVGICLLCLALDIAYLVLSSTQHLVEITGRRVRVHFTCVFLSIVCFFINNIPHMSERVSFRSLNKCWKGNAYEGHAQIAALTDCCLLGVIFVTTGITLLLISLLIKCKTRSGELLIVPEYMRVLDVEPDVVVEDVQQAEEGGSQARVSTEIPSSDLDAKPGETGRMYNRYEAVAEQPGAEKQDLNRHDSSRKRISSWKGEKESSSKESSCHENSGYISEGTGQEEQVQRRQSLAFNSTRRRFKSDSEIQEPKSQTYVMVRKRRKHSSRKVLEDQVIEALENFFVTDPSKLLFKALGSQKQCELSAHLIDDNSDDKATEEETSFNDKEIKNNEIRKKNRKLPLRKARSLRRASSCKDRRRDRTQWSTSSYKEKSNTLKFPSNFSSEKAPETISLKEKSKLLTTGSRQTEMKVDDPNTDLIDLKKQSEGVISPKIVVEDTDHDNTAPSAGVDKGTKEVKNSCLSVNVDVHRSDSSRSISSIDTIGTDVDCHFKDNTGMHVKSVSMREHSLSKWVEFLPDTDRGVRFGGVMWEDEINSENDGCFVEVETQTEKQDTENVEELTTDSVFNDMENDNHSEADNNAEIETEMESKGDTECDIKREDNVTSAAEIEIESSAEKRKEELLLFKDYCKRYLLQPYKNVLSLMLVYVACLLPQIVLDIYRVVIGKDETVHDQTDGIMSICSDAAMSIFLVAIAVMFLWRYRTRRNVKLDNMLQQ